jgi:hypothetical protein
MYSEIERLESIHRDIVTTLQALPLTGTGTPTEAELSDGSNVGRGRILSRLPIDPQDGVPMPGQYQHRGIVVEIPEEDNAGVTRGRTDEAMRLTVVLHMMYRINPADQLASTYSAWGWEEAVRGQIRRAPLLYQYYPRYVGTRRATSRASAEWWIATVTFTFTRSTTGG